MPARSLKSDWRKRPRARPIMWPSMQPRLTSSKEPDGSPKATPALRLSSLGWQKTIPPLFRTMASFLTKAYRYKEVSDYTVNRRAVVTMQDAEAAIVSAAGFLECIHAILS